MKKLTLLAFLMVIIVFSSFAQQWTKHSLPRFRKIKDIHCLNMTDISVVGGWPQNDSITYMAFSEDEGENWEYYDIFPGKLLHTAAYQGNGNAYAGGDNAAWYTSTDFGKTWTVSSNSPIDDLNINTVKFGQWGRYFISGGFMGSDGFLLKNNDAGTGYEEILSHTTELKDIAIFDNTHLAVCGTENTLLYTQNGGNDWENAIPSGYAYVYDLNGIDQFNNFGIAVGGKQGADSLQVILKSTDGGQSWAEIHSIIGPCLHQVQIINDTLAYAVGDYATLLFTNDAGENWENISLPDIGETHLYTVHFINEHYGAVGGDWGIVFTYNDGETNNPEATTLDASNITNNSAKLHANFNCGFLTSQVSFEYGLDESFNNQIELGTFSGGSLETISYTLNNLTEDSHYYFRVKLTNDYGTFYGEPKLFYTGNPIPNWDFEFWEEISQDFPDNWRVNDSAYEKTDYAGDMAIRLFSANQEDDVSVVMNASIEGEEVQAWHIPVEYISGGQSINIRPDSIFVKTKYNIEDQDTAMLFLGLIQGDHYVSENFFFINGNQNNFVTLGFEIDYSTSETPDRFVIAITNSNPFNEETSFNSSIEISEVHFSDNNPVITNSDFDNWTTNIITSPLSWQYEQRHLFAEDGTSLSFIERIDQAAHHNYAIKLENRFLDYDTIVGRISLKDWNEGIPINKRFSSFSGEFKYFPEAQDTASIFIVMYSEGNQCGWGNYREEATHENWTSFTAEIHYDNETTVPDSMNLFIETSQWPPTGESQLYVDKLSVDGDFIPVEQIFKDEPFAYPNPVEDMLFFNESTDDIQIFDNTGKLIFETNEQCKKISLIFLKPGYYILKSNKNKQPIIKL